MKTVVKKDGVAIAIEELPSSRWGSGPRAGGHVDGVSASLSRCWVSCWRSPDIEDRSSEHPKVSAFGARLRFALPRDYDAREDSGPDASGQA